LKKAIPILFCLALFILVFVLSPSEGYQTTIDTLAVIATCFSFLLCIILFFRLKSISLVDVLRKEDQSNYSGFGIKISKIQAIALLALGSFFFLNILIVQPLIKRGILFFNSEENSTALKSETISFQRIYSNSSSANKHYYLPIQVEDETCELIITPSQKERIEANNMIDNLHQGKLGFFYLKD